MRRWERKATPRKMTKPASGTLRNRKRASSAAPARADNSMISKKASPASHVGSKSADRPQPKQRPATLPVAKKSSGKRSERRELDEGETMSKQKSSAARAQPARPDLDVEPESTRVPATAAPATDLEVAEEEFDAEATVTEPIANELEAPAAA